MPSTHWSKFRRTFRWCRIAALLLVLLVVTALLWLNTMGLPTALQDRLMAALARQNLVVDAGRIRLEGYHRILLEDVRLRTTATNAPELRIRTAEIKLNRKALRHLTVDVDGLNIRNGSLAIPLSSNGEIRTPLILTNLSAELTFHRDDRWELSRLRSVWHGMEFELSMTLTNASALNALSLSSATKATNAAPSTWQKSVQDAVDVMEQIEFDHPPRIKLLILGDAKNEAALRGNLRVQSSNLRSSWGSLGPTWLRFNFEPSKPATSYVVGVSIRTDSLRTPWTEADNLEATASAQYPILTNLATFQTRWEVKAKEIRAGGVQIKRPFGRIDIGQLRPNEASFQSGLNINAASVVTPWMNSDEPSVELGLKHSYPLGTLTTFLASSIHGTNASQAPRAGLHLPNPLTFWLLSETWEGTWKGQLGRSITDFGKFNSLQLGGRMQPSSGARPVTQRGNMMEWLADMDILSTGRLLRFTKGNLDLPEMLVGFHWKSPWLDVDRLDAQLEHGVWTNQVRFNQSTRRLEGAGKLVAPPIWLAGILTTNLPSWVSRVKLSEYPAVDLRVAMNIPPIDAAPGIWGNSIRSNLLFEAETTLTNLGVDEVIFPKVEIKAGLREGVAHLEKLGFITSEGHLEASGWVNPESKQFQTKVNSEFNPRVLQPLFQDLAGLFEYVQMADIPKLQVTAHGRYDNISSIEGHGSAELGAFTLRGEGFSDATTIFGITNRLVYFTNVLAHYFPPGGSTQMLKSPLLVLDLPNMALWITNGFSTYDPYAFTRIIGPKTTEAIMPYQFGKLPAVHVHGKAPLDDRVKADLHFDLTGGPFKYWRFNANQVSGQMHWVGDHLNVTNLIAQMYDGTLNWTGDFDFLPGGEAAYSFKSTVTNINLSLALADILTGTNQIEGVLNGSFNLESANSRSIETWKGAGMAEMSDGFLWSIPIFGAFSGFLDSITPGLGKSRLKSGTATFVVQDQAVSTHDMELRAPAFRLKYNGKVGFDSALDARAEMEFFRDTWIVGRLFSTALWPLSKAFETKVSGTLQQPVTEAMHIPKIIMAPFRPFQTLRELFPKAFSEGSTNNAAESIQK